MEIISKIWGFINTGDNSSVIKKVGSFLTLLLAGLGAVNEALPGVITFVTKIAAAFQVAPTP